MKENWAAAHLPINWEDRYHEQIYSKREAFEKGKAEIKRIAAQRLERDKPRNQKDRKPQSI